MNKLLKYPSVVDRYFTKYFYKEQPNEDICVLGHSNRICVVTLSPNHQALADGPIKSVSYTIKGKDLATENRVQGKKKRNAFQTQPKRDICIVTSATGKEYKIKSGVSGRLLEVNQRLMSNPTLLNSKFQTDGYIAIIKHAGFGSDPICQKLLSEEQYNKQATKKDDAEEDVAMKIEEAVVEAEKELKVEEVEGKDEVGNKEAVENEEERNKGNKEVENEEERNEEMTTS